MVFDFSTASVCLSSVSVHRSIIDLLFYLSVYCSSIYLYRLLNVINIYSVLPEWTYINAQLSLTFDGGN